MGPDNGTEKEWGVNYRALNDLFNISHDRRDTIKYELGVQMVEIYNEQIRDLLGNGGSQKKYPSYSRLGFQYSFPFNGRIHVFYASPEVLKLPLPTFVMRHSCLQ